jgi:hypothetical protein
MASLYSKVFKFLEGEGKSSTEIKGWIEDEKTVLLVNDGDGDRIENWDSATVGVAQPTEEQLNALESEAITLENNNQVVRTRLNLYGSTAEQLEYIVENGVDAFVAKQQQIKTDNPKG